jgi:hypothetical protein
MAETALITTTDIRVYRDIDPKLDSTRIASFIMEIQRSNLRSLLGDALYLAFMAVNRTSGIYKDLLDGKDYAYNDETIHYYGLKPVLCYWFLAIFAREGELFHSAHGAIELINNPQQNFERSREKERIAVGYMQTAQDYANDVIKFLDTEKASYPLWKSNEESNVTNFISFRV